MVKEEYEKIMKSIAVLINQILINDIYYDTFPAFPALLTEYREMVKLYHELWISDPMGEVW